MDTRRAYVRERLRGMGLDPWEARGGFFVWAPVPGGESGREFAQRLLRETGVLVNPGAPFGPTGDWFVRISFATDEGRLREGLNRLARFLSSEVTAADVATVCCPSR
jgi:aspartate/methionine/tyrosine aminotransferase